MFLLTACGNKRAEVYTGLVEKGNIFEMFNCGYYLENGTLFRVGFDMPA